MTPEKKAEEISDEFLVYGDFGANARLEAAIAAALREAPCPYVVQAAGGTAHCALAEREGQLSALERAVLKAADEWEAACQAAELGRADYLEGGQTWKECVRANRNLRAAVADLRRARDVKEGEG